MYLEFRILELDKIIEISFFMFYLINEKILV